MNAQFGAFGSPMQAKDGERRESRAGGNLAPDGAVRGHPAFLRRVRQALFGLALALVAFDLLQDWLVPDLGRWWAHLVRFGAIVLLASLALKRISHAFQGQVQREDRDLASGRRAQEALRRQRDFAEGLVDTAPVMVLLLDPQGRIVRFNRCMEEHSGYSLEEVEGEDWFSVFLPEKDRQQTRRLFLEADARAPTQAYTLAMVTKSGRERGIEWYRTTLRDANEHVGGILAIGRDITEQKQLEDQFRQAQKMEAVGRLAGGVAHDFNTILLTIVGRVEQLLAGQGLSSPSRHQLTEIAKAAERATSLTRQLLAFSRQQPGEPRILDLNQVIRELEDMLQRLIGEDVTVVCNLSTDAGHISADRSQIEQVVLNLAVNARDAMPDGGELIIETDLVEEIGVGSTSPSTWVLLTVRDTGQGMDPETQKRAFEPFFTTKEPGKGTGLGLSTVYGIVSQSGGDVRLETAPGRGTTVLIYLPRVEGHRATSAEVRRAPAPQARVSGTILLVEDDRAARELLQDHLEEQGFDVVPAENGSEALHFFERHEYEIDLLVTDWLMPQVTGTELAEQIRARRPDTRILYISGYTAQQIPLEYLQRKGVRFLHKPFSLREFSATISSLLSETP